MSFEERLTIEDMWTAHDSISKIARFLERPRSEIKQELERGNMLYFEGLDEHELSLMKLHTRIKYSAEYAQQFVVRNNIYYDERYQLTPELKLFLEDKLERLSPEKIKSLYPDEVPISTRMIRYYINQVSIKRRSIHSERHITDNQSSDDWELTPVHRIDLEDDIAFGNWFAYVNSEIGITQRISTLILVEERTTYVVLIRLEDSNVQNVYLGFDMFLNQYRSNVQSIDLFDVTYLDEQKIRLLKYAYATDMHSINRIGVDRLTQRLNEIHHLLPSYEDLALFTQHEFDVLSSILNERLIMHDHKSIRIQDWYELEIDQCLDK